MANTDTRNFLVETSDVLALNGYQWDDVDAIYGAESGFQISVETFTNIADIEYDSGFGGQQMPKDIVIQMKDGAWFTRGEYDGSEWWEQSGLPVVPPDIKTPVKLKHGCWDTLAELCVFEEAPPCTQ